MQMTESEIKTNILQAKDQKKQIPICAQINACSTEKIKEILRKQGVDMRTLKGANDAAKGKKKQPAPEPAPDTDKALLQLFNRVNELTAQRDAIVKELCEIKTQIIMINKAIDGEEV